MRRLLTLLLALVALATAPYNVGFRPPSAGTHTYVPTDTVASATRSVACPPNDSQNTSDVTATPNGLDSTARNFTLWIKCSIVNTLAAPGTVNGYCEYDPENDGTYITIASRSTDGTTAATWYSASLTTKQPSLMRVRARVDVSCTADGDASSTTDVLDWYVEY